MRIAVTGATGMIGSSIVNTALNEGHEVVAISRPGSRRISNIPLSHMVKVIECDISEYKRISGEEECDIFLHLAWEKTFGEGRDDGYAQLKNVEYTLDAVTLAKSWGASAFVGAGSQAEYGNVNQRMGPLTPTDPTSGYGIAKYSAGKLAGLMCRKLGMRFCWTRILSVYGEHDGDHTLIMYLIDSLLAGEVPQLTECGQIWDYIYSKDAARALLSVGFHGIDGKVYPIGSGQCRKLREYVEDIRDLINPELELGFGTKEYYPHQPMILCADISQLTNDTGFVPKYGFKEAISTIIRNRINENHFG